MKISHVLTCSLGIALLTVCYSPGVKQLQAQQDAPSPAADDREGAEILTRGPVHEAFAGTVTFDPEPGVEVAKTPPEPIEELPPDQKPEGDNVAWIPGYWAWDDDRDDFLWVSGIWRALPPGRQWIPGYWAEAGSSFQWITGYWADAKLEEIEYLPEPPATIEEGPSVEAPSENDIWVPGCWVWHSNRYAWRPGYWVAAQPNWIWTPACYTWSPNGYVFVDGYWDYSVARRGILFAPVYFSSAVFGRQGFVYSPMTVINVNVFANQLFLRPRFHHYYFGDYYATNYVDAGFYPWFSVQSRGFGYDPFFVHQRWMNRQNPNWVKSIQADFKNRVDHEDARPPRTFAAMQQRLKAGGAAKRDNLLVAMSLEQAVKGDVSIGDGKNPDQKSEDVGMRFKKVDKAERQKFAEQGQEVQKFRAQRRSSEGKGDGKAAAKDESNSPATQDKNAEKADDRPARDGVRGKMKLAKSPIAAANTSAGESSNAPPKSPEAPQVDTKVEPMARQARTDRNSPERTTRPGRTADEGKTPKKPKSETQPDPKNPPKDEPNDVPKSNPKETPPRKGPRKPEMTPEPKPEPKPGTDPQPKPGEKPERKPETKPRPMPTPKVEGKPDPLPQPKVQPKPEPKPMPEPKVVPKPEPKPSPKPAPAPKVEPKPENPKSPPRSESQPEPKRKPKVVPEPKPN